MKSKLPVIYTFCHPPARGLVRLNEKIGVILSFENNIHYLSERIVYFQNYSICAKAIRITFGYMPVTSLLVVDFLPKAYRRKASESFECFITAQKLVRSTKVLETRTICAAWESNYDSQQLRTCTQALIAGLLSALVTYRNEANGIDNPFPIPLLRSEKLEKLNERTNP